MIPAIEEAWSDTVFEAVRRRYGLDEGWTELEGHESKVFDCTREGEPCILKITHELRRSPDEIRGELDFVHFLAARGLPVSPPLPALDSETVLLLDGERGRWIAHLCAKAPGDPIDVEAWTPELIANWGALLGRLHRASREYRPSKPEWTRRQWHEDPQLDSRSFVPDDETRLHAAADALLADLHELPRDESCFGLIHEDLHPWNLVAEGSELHAFDFDEVLHGWFTQDIAFAAYHVLLDQAWYHAQGKHEAWTGGRAMDRARFAAYLFENLIEGYRREHPLSDEWLRTLPLFLRLAHLESYVIAHRDRGEAALSEAARVAYQERRDEIEDPATWSHVADWCRG